MKRLLDDLQTLIVDQTSLYRKLLAVLRCEHDIIKSAAVDELHNNNKKKEVVILQIKLLDESCSRILGKIQQKLPDRLLKPTIGYLTEIIDEPYLTPLRGGYNKLISLARSVKELNQDNDRLINGSLRVIKSSLSFLMTCAASDKTFYEKNGRLAPTNALLPLLSEEA